MNMKQRRYIAISWEPNKYRNYCFENITKTEAFYIANQLRCMYMLEGKKVEFTCIGKYPLI